MHTNINVALGYDLYNKSKRVASIMRVSVSEITREALEKHIAELVKSKEYVEQVRQLAQDDKLYGLQPSQPAV